MTFAGRREDDRLLTGRGRYASDWSFPGQLYGFFLRSDRAHAAIGSMELKNALASPGVAGIFTGEDTAHFKTPPPIVNYPLKVPHRDVLARGRVRHVGQELALVVATSAAAAQDAAERIEVEFEDLPAVVEAREALAPGAPLLHESVPGNLAFEFEYGDAAETDAAFAAAAHVTRLTLDSTRVCANPMEPKACVVAYDAASDRYDVCTSSQGMSLMLPDLVAITGVAAERIRIRAQDVGGGFGVRSQAYAEYAALMLAAKSLGRPVKWVGSRFETIVSDHHGRAAELRGELALDRDGRFLGLRHRWTVNMGAYLSQAGPLINSVNPSTHAINVYRIGALHGRHALVLTNTTPTTAYRGAGRPNVAYLVERLVDEAARETGIDRVELRRRNLIARDAYPYKTPVGSTYDSGDAPGQLDKVLQLAEWSSFGSRKARSRKLRGIGLAVFCEPASGAAAPREEAAIRFGESGNATLYVMSGPSGQGHETVFPEIVGKVLGMDAGSISLRASDPEGPRLAGGGTIGSRSMMVHGGALFLAAQAAVKKGLDLAAKALEVAVADVEFREGRYRVKGTDLSMGFGEVAKRYGPALDTQDAMATATAFPGGAHVAEVEIDPETGVIDLVSYVAVDDCGRILNHALLDGQLHGGIVQGIGQVLAEHVAYDPGGQLLTGTFMDYAMPRSGALTRVLLVDHSIPSPTNPLGVKGAGEAGTTGSIPALANAVIDALRPLGIHHLDFPYTPARVWEAIEKARAG